YTVELPKGELLIEVGFENGRDLDSSLLSATEWFITARDSLTSKELWNGRFDEWEWFDHWGDSDEANLFVEMGDHLIALIDSVLTNKVRLARFAKKPVLHLWGRSWPKGQRTKLELLVAGKWIEWDKIASLSPDRQV